MATNCGLPGCATIAALIAASAASGWPSAIDAAASCVWIVPSIWSMTPWLKVGSMRRTSVMYSSATSQSRSAKASSASRQ
jgi:hypothetical protein